MEIDHIETKKREELVALHAATVIEVLRATAGFGTPDDSSSKARENLGIVGQELLRRLEEGETLAEKLRIAEGKLRELAEQARQQLKPD